MSKFAAMVRRERCACSIVFDNRKALILRAMWLVWGGRSKTLATKKKTACEAAANTTVDGGRSKWAGGGGLQRPLVISWNLKYASKCLGGVRFGRAVGSRLDEVHPKGLALMRLRASES